MVIRSRDGTRKPKTYFTIKHPLPQCFHAALSPIIPSEPTCYTQATQSKEWRAAMMEEFDALLKNQTWELVPPSPTMNVVGCK